MALSYSEHFNISKSEVTPGFSQKPFHLLNMLQDAAEDAIDALGLTDKWKEGCSWMARRYSIRLKHPLMSGDKGIITTGHRALRDLYSVRRFRLFDEEENLIGQVDSEWIFVDLEKRRPQRFSRTMPKSFYDTEAEEEFTGDFEKLSLPERVDLQRCLHVRLGEIDGNGHVNNAYYLSWAVESVPLDIYLNCGIVEAHIFYKHEAEYGMGLNVETQQDGLIFRHVIKSEDGDVMALAMTKWERVTEE